MEQIALQYQYFHDQAQAAINNSSSGKELAQLELAWAAIQSWRQFVQGRVDPITWAGFDTVQHPSVAPLSWAIGGKAGNCYTEFRRMEKQMNWLVNKYGEGNVSINVSGNNNVVTGGNVSSSPVQAGNSGNVSQSTNYSQPSETSLRSLVDTFNSHISELNLGESEVRKVLAQVATIEAQLADVPNPTIIQEAGKTIKNITEGALGGLLATAAQPGIWAAIQSTLSAF